MRRKQIHRLLVGFFVCCLCVMASSVVQAGEYDQQVEIHMMHAQIAYQDGRTQDAVRDYNKVLMLDPQNREATDMLNQIVNEGGLYTRARQSNYQIEDLGKHIKVYKEMTSVLEDEKQRIDDRFHTMLQQEQTLARYVVVRESEIASLHGKIEQLHQRTKPLPRRAIVIVKQAEVFTRKDLKQKHKELKKKSRVLARKQRRLSTLEASVDQAVLSQKHLTDLSGEVNKLREDLSIRDATQDRIYDELEDYVYLRSHALEQVRDRMITKELDSLYKEKLLIARLTELIDMNETLDEYRYYLDERDLMLKERQENVNELRALMNDLNG